MATTKTENTSTKGQLLDEIDGLVDGDYVLCVEGVSDEGFGAGNLYFIGPNRTLMTDSANIVENSTAKFIKQ